MPVKHTQAECKQAMAAMKELVEQIKRIDDQEVKNHVCDSIIQLCDQLLNEKD
jgi:DNA-binding ferritin-like protein (Dps family)